LGRGSCVSHDQFTFCGQTRQDSSGAANTAAAGRVTCRARPAALSVQMPRLRRIALAEFGALGALVGDEQDVAELSVDAVPLRGDPAALIRATAVGGAVAVLERDVVAGVEQPLKF
jgi:hypothetical protein